MTTWKLDRSGTSASTTLDNGAIESRLLTAIPATDTILPSDPLTPAEQRAVIQEQIESLEREQMLPRITREGLLATAVTLAASQGITEAQLYAGNIGYHKTKDFDAVIVALRAQMEVIV